MAPQTTTRMTYEEYAKLPDDGKRYEIIDGELFVNASPVTRHQRIVRRLLTRLDHYFETHGGGEVFVSPYDVVLSDDNVVEPDLVVVKAERLQIVGPDNIQGVPDLLIEVLSSSTRRRDAIQKRKLYERFGVSEYWLVDPELGLVKIYRLIAGAFQNVAEIDTDTGGTITSPLLPNFALDVEAVFAE